MLIKYAQSLTFQKQLVLFTSMKTLYKRWMFFILFEKLFSFLKYLHFCPDFFGYIDPWRNSTLHLFQTSFGGAVNFNIVFPVW